MHPHPITTDWPPHKILGYDIRVEPGSDGFHCYTTDENLWFSALDVERLPEFTGPYQRLWANFDEMRAFIARNPDLPLERAWTVAIVRLFDPELEEKELLESRPPIPAHWEFIGFDVSDYFQLSGLYNAGRDLRIVVGGAVVEDQLNEYGLFTSVAEAHKFCEWVDEQVPEHANFYAHVIFKLPETVEGTAPTAKHS